MLCTFVERIAPLRYDGVNNMIEAHNIENW